MQIEALNSDKDRAAVDAFFAVHIPTDQARVPILPRANDPHRGYRSHILAIRDNNEVIAALYAAPPVLEVAEMTMIRGLPAHFGETALAEFVMLYDVAVRREALVVRAEVRDLCLIPCRGRGFEAGGSLTGETPGRVEAALTKSWRVSTVG